MSRRRPPPYLPGPPVPPRQSASTPPDPPSGARRRRPRRRRRLTALLALLAAALPAAAVGLGVQAFVTDRVIEGPSSPSADGGDRRDGYGDDAARAVASLGTTDASASDRENMSTIATAKRGRVRVHPRPGARRGTRLFVKREGQKGPLTFLVERQRKGWVKVLLPERPSGSTGWVRERELSLEQTNYRVKIELRRYRITVWQGDEVVQRTKVGLGQSATPTPSGRYYLTELIKPPSPDGIYGAYAFSLSGFSDVVTDFNGGNGQLGLHGTNDLAGLGKNVSKGCIRVSNKVIRNLAKRLPLGTPVVVKR